VLGLKPRPPRRSRDEAEKPFWISFSDMMTALMVLFLVAMTVTLLAVTRNISETEQKKSERDVEIHKLTAKLQEITTRFPGITLRGQTIDFGDQARFDTDSNKLTPEQMRHLRCVTPDILRIARDPFGQKWLKRIIVVGYADQRGTYLHNLNLSMERSERVLCALLAKPEPGEEPMSKEDRMLIQELFLVGGSSFNSLKKTLEESRRIELKLEFLEVGEVRPVSQPVTMDDGSYCPLD
jgi:flagellar motor protein MotB